MDAEKLKSKELGNVLNNLIEGDCLDKMGQIPAASVDMILCDLPYNKWVCGKTTC